VGAWRRPRTPPPLNEPRPFLTSSSREHVDEEPVTDAIVAGVVLTVFGQVAAGTLVMTTFPLAMTTFPLVGCSADASHESSPGCRAGSSVPLEALAPLVGPFVALGRHGDLGDGHQALLGIAGALQVIGLASIVLGSTIERPVARPVAVSIDGGPQGVRLEIVQSW
jgi:hypothetical protein